MKPAVGLTLSTTAPDATDGNMRAAMSRSMPTSDQLLFNVKVEPSTKSTDSPILGTLDPKLKDKRLARARGSTAASRGHASPRGVREIARVLPPLSPAS